jgi:putative FmdB family regulatory protein
MPLYEYRCKSCGHTFEAIQKFSDRPLKKCAECSGPLEKLISRSSFQLKGGGWFISDYSRSKTAATPSESESKSASPPKSESPSKSTGPSGSSGSCCGSGSCSH